MHNFKTKYGIRDENIYNFDETRFLMGQISTTKIVTSFDWKRHVKLIQLGNWE